MDMRDQFDMFVLAISIHRILLHNKLLTLSFSRLCKFCFCISILCIFYFLSSIVIKIFTFFLQFIRVANGSGKSGNSGKNCLL